ncbi:hypothetical protein LEP1GSC192_1209 [Leptospira sp. B5-022]|nr:hypothetical protein LEP1GSC192_1209 [Leptospira sp. B5-022]
MKIFQILFIFLFLYNCVTDSFIPKGDSKKECLETNVIYGLATISDEQEINDWLAYSLLFCSDLPK